MPGRPGSQTRIRSSRSSSGIRTKSLLGCELWQIGVLGDEAASKAAMRELQQSQYIRYEDLPLQTKSGAHIDVEFVSNVYVEGDEPVIQCNIRDITERRKMQESARLLSGARGVSDDAIISKSLGGIIQSWNASAERLFGYSAAEAVGRPVSMLMPPGCAGEEDMFTARLAAGERVEHHDTVRLRKDGRTIPVSLTVSPIQDESGRTVGASEDRAGHHRPQALGHGPPRERVAAPFRDGLDAAEDRHHEARRRRGLPQPSVVGVHGPSLRRDQGPGLDSIPAP